MKSNIKILLISVVCSTITFFIFNSLVTIKENNYEVSYETEIIPQYSLNKISNQRNITSSSSLPDLTFAASKSIDAVVHVKNTSIVEDNDSWALQFFYGDDSRKKVGTGSGVIISPDGYIVTNYHVIENSSEVIVTTNDNKEYEAVIIGFDEIYDIKMANYIPKPELAPYEQMIEQFDIETKSSAMFDDIAKNLVPAKTVGFTSVWIDAGYENFSDDIKASKQYLDHETTNITEFLEDVNKGKI